MSEKSPIHDEVGSALDGAAIESLNVIRQSDGQGSKSVAEVAQQWASRNGIEVSSLHVLQEWASAQSVVNAREYQDHIVQYAMDWEQVVTERVDAEIKNVRKLQGDRTHYERKVEGMRKRANEFESKGKPNPPAQAEKLERNEVKLKEAYTTHELEAGRLCVLIEAVTQEGWRDLYFLVKNYMKWESNRVGREGDVYTQLATTIDSMKVKQNANKATTPGKAGKKGAGGSAKKKGKKNVAKETKS